jgi:hypothetical protein
MEGRRSSYLLNYDEGFEPCLIDEGDEYMPNGIFIFNITKMNRYVKENIDLFPLATIKISKLNANLPVKECHIDSADVTKPVTIAEISPGRYNLIDGRHRVAKSGRQGLSTVRAYILEPKHHIRFLSDVKGYKVYVEYWNDKLNELTRD